MLSDGRPCDVQTITMMSEKTSKILGTWEREVLGFSPDVIVLVYGHYESGPPAPAAMARAACQQSQGARPRRCSESFIATAILQRVWLLLARLQARSGQNRGTRPSAAAALAGVAADLEVRFISQVQTVASPLVIVFELLPPAKRSPELVPRHGSPHRRS